MNNEQFKFFGDAGSIAIIGSTLLGWLPTIATVLSVVWVLIRIYETCTVQSLIHGADCKPWEKKNGD
jgi:hypothetical protein